MPNYQAESFYRAKITSSITQSAVCPITVRLSKLPSRSTGLLTISPNTEFEEIVEYDTVNTTNKTVNISKRGINPASTLLTTNGVDYNNTLYQREHTQNDIIRGDVNHIHINQAIGNTVLATEAGVGISKLSVAAANPADPIVVGTNDPRVGNASTTQKATVKLSVAPVSATEPIAVGDNDPRLGARVAVGRIDLTSATTTLTSYNIGFRPKMVRLTATRGSALGPMSTSVSLDGGSTYTVYTMLDDVASPPSLQFRHDTQNGAAVLLRNLSGSSLINIVTLGFTATGFTLSAPSWTGYTTCSITYEAFA